jgi:hypothetical protein
MPFYVYGAGSQCHISHILLKAPNIELGAANVKLTLDADLEDEELARGAILCLTGVPEAPMQPFPVKSSDDPRDIFFRPGQEFQVKVWRDLKHADESGPHLLPDSLDDFGPELASGTVRLRNEILVDAKEVNKDPFDHDSGEAENEKWRELFQEIRDQLK